MNTANLPLYARVALEWLSNSGARTGARLDALLDAYARTYGLDCDDDTRREAHARAATLPDFEP